MKCSVAGKAARTQHRQATAHHQAYGGTFLGVKATPGGEGGGGGWENRSVADLRWRVLLQELEDLDDKPGSRDVSVHVVGRHLALDDDLRERR